MYRIYSDFIMRSRLEEYRELLTFAMRCGYEVCSIPAFWYLTDRGKCSSSKKILILRHDIDTDLHTAHSMWQIERSLNIRSSYFFRLSTVDVALMQEIEAFGGSAGYHYEELATVAKREGLTTRQKVVEKLPEIRELFESNLTHLRERSQLPLRFVAAHGDFVNRRLGIPNWVMLQDPELRSRLNIELEAYDSALMKYIHSRHTDREYPSTWVPESPLKAIEARIESIHVLVHPRQWRVNWRENIIDDIQRMYQGFVYSGGIKNLAFGRRQSLGFSPSDSFQDHTA